MWTPSLTLYGWGLARLIRPNHLPPTVPCAVPTCPLDTYAWAVPWVPCTPVVPEPTNLDCLIALNSLYTSGYTLIALCSSNTLGALVSLGALRFLYVLPNQLLPWRPDYRHKRRPVFLVRSLRPRAPSGSQRPVPCVPLTVIPLHAWSCPVRWGLTAPGCLTAEEQPVPWSFPVRWFPAVPPAPCVPLLINAFRPADNLITLNSLGLALVHQYCKQHRDYPVQWQHASFPCI